MNIFSSFLDYIIIQIKLFITIMSRTINMHTQSPSTVNSKVFDEQTKAEMLVSIQLYLDGDPLYKDVAAKLKENIEKYKVYHLKKHLKNNIF
jgi:hypothetical protein